MDLAPSWPLLSAFLLASMILALTPGPGVMYIVTRSLIQGRRAGLVSVAGVAAGNLVNALAVAYGLGALFAFGSAAFTVVKLAGACYLIYLGVRMLRTALAEPVAAASGNARLGRLFRDGFLVALLNPKTTLFFAAFLPQFLGPATATTGAISVLGAVFVAIALVTDSLYALAAGWVAPFLARARGTRRAGRLAGGGVFIGLGVLAALSEAPAPD